MSDVEGLDWLQRERELKMNKVNKRIIQKKEKKKKNNRQQSEEDEAMLKLASNIDQDDLMNLYCPLDVIRSQPFIQNDAGNVVPPPGST